MNGIGYSIHDSVLSSDECDDILDAITSSGVKLGKGGTRNLMSVAGIRKVANDVRLLSIAASFLGKQCVAYKATLFEKTGRSNWLVAWHQDTALPVTSDIDLDGWGPMSVKDGVKFVHAATESLARIVALRIHLDPSHSDNGPLRVISGSHGKRYTEDLEFSDTVERGEEVECVANKGCVIAMSPLLIHASSKAKNDDPRRVVHIEYADSLDVATGVRLAFA